MNGYPHLMRARPCPRRSASLPTVLTVALGVVACTPQVSSVPADSDTATVTIDGKDLPSAFSVDCTQRSWLWTIETVAHDPGFTAMLETGGTVDARIIRIRGLQGFTGSAAESPDVRARADGSTFTISGIAHGAFDEHPTRAASVQYRIRAHC